MDDTVQTPTVGLTPIERRIENDFSFHPATPITGPKHDDVRQNCKQLALWLAVNLPPGRELSLALTNLEQVMMWANAAVARTIDADVPEPAPS